MGFWNRETPVVRRGSTVSHDTRTDVSFYEYVEQRFDATEAAAILAVQALRDVVRVRFDANESAVSKSEIAVEDRFKSVNEFRAQLNDQTKTFATRDALDALSKETTIGKEGLAREVATNTATLNTNAAALAARLANLEGRIFAYAGAIGIFVTFISIAISTIVHFLK